jgi:hypothetical protein
MKLGQTENLTFPDFALDPIATAPTVDYTFGGDMYAGYSPLPDPTMNFHDPIYDPPPVGAPEPSEPTTSIWDSLAEAATAAIRVRAVYQQSQQPTSARPSWQAGGAGAITPTATGMLITRNPLTGAIQTSRPAVGVRYGLPDGRTMVNNGDGTFSLISGFGAETRVSYSAGGAATNWILYGALGMGALLLLRK